MNKKRAYHVLQYMRHDMVTNDDVSIQCVTVASPEEHPAIRRIDPRQEYERTTESKFYGSLVSSRQLYEHRSYRGNSVVRWFDCYWPHVTVEIYDFVSSTFALWRVRSAFTMTC